MKNKINKINFVTGETYTLAELFSGNRRIIIPDLQRDYCWGDSVHTEEKKELVSGFVNTLIQQSENNNYKGILNLGLIYGYEDPANHIQLCDGQQRITTLYLLLGMLNRKVNNNAFRSLLISDYEFLQDDKEPYLQYSIRESSLYFLSDLVCHFFIKVDGDCYYVDSCSKIKTCSWYFNEYNFDPSICSMLRALDIMDSILSNKDDDWCMNFGVFLSTKLTFMYYDMESRRNGEETFVVINTTGEPLSNTQNLKPLIYTEPRNQNYTRQEGNTIITMPMDWENIETWFWKKRMDPNDTADAGFNEFLRWVTILHSDKEEQKRILSEGIYTFPKDKISFKSIYSYWTIVQFLYESWEHKELLSINYLSPSANKDAKSSKTISQIDCFQLLPLIAYCREWGISDKHDRNLLRLYQFVHNLTRLDNVRKAVNELIFDVIQIARSCKDIVNLIGSEIENEISKIILSKEEKVKLKIIKSDPENRNDIEDAFWEAQSCKFVPSHNIWSGQILPIIEWSTDNDVFNLNKFREYLHKFDEIFVGECNGNIDIVRRALLTRGLSVYPKIFRGYTNYSFGWEWSDWNNLINDNKEVIKDFFDDLLKGSTLQQMIDMYPHTNDWSEFVHEDYLLHYCEQKNIQWHDDFGWLLIKRQRSSKYNFNSVNNLHILHFLQNNLQINQWEIWLYDGNRVFIENKVQNVVFNIWYHKSKWNIQWFKRNSEVEQSLKSVIDNTWTFNGERYEKSIDYIPQENYSYPNVLQELKEDIKKLLTE